MTKLQELSQEALLDKYDEITAVLRERLSKPAVTKYVKGEPSTIKISSVDELKKGDKVKFIGPRSEHKSPKITIGKIYEVCEIYADGDVLVNGDNPNSTAKPFFSKYKLHLIEKVVDESSTSSVEDTQETVEHEGLVLRKVDRSSKTGDYVKFDGLVESCTMNNTFYEVKNIDHYVDEFGGLKSINGWWGSDPIIEIYEVVGAIPQIPKSANQQRHETIQRAREFVEEHGDDFNFDVDDKREIVFAWKLVFEKMNVTAISGSAKCMPGDVFNEWIGKAIALARALEIGVPEEFLNAVQPDYYVPGHIITFPVKDKWHMKYQYRVDSIEDTYNNLTKLFENGGLASANLNCTQYEETDLYSALPIIDDTNAVYVEG